MESKHKEYVQRRTGNVSHYFLDDETVSVVTKILNGDFVSLAWMDVAEVLSQAQSQKHDILVKKCVRYFFDEVTLSNVCSFLEVSMAFNIQSLYKMCLEICTEAALFILEDSSDFYRVQQQTITVIASQPNLNADETDIYHALWVKAIVQCCQKDLEPSYQNISEVIEPYSSLVNFGAIDERKLRLRNNDQALKYYLGKIRNSTKIGRPAFRRKFRSQVNLDPRFFVSYESGEIQAFIQLTGNPYTVEFSVQDFPTYLMQVKMSCVAELKALCKCDKIVVSLRDGKDVLLEVKDATNKSLESRDFGQTRFFDGSRVRQFLYRPKRIVKLRPDKKYTLSVENFTEDFFWPVSTADESGESFIKFSCENIAGFTGLKLMKAS